MRIRRWPATVFLPSCAREEEISRELLLRLLSSRSGIEESLKKELSGPPPKIF